jgi:hypothetical protein
MKLKLSKDLLTKSRKSIKIQLPKYMTCALAEEIGLHIGDGSMNFYSDKGFYQLRGHISDDKGHYQSRIKELYKLLFGVDVHLREMKSTGVIGFQIWDDCLVRFKNEVLGLPLGKKEQITLPKLINSKRLFFSFLRGLFDTDGSIYFENKRGKPYPRIDIKTISEKLCLDLVCRLNEYGIHATYYKYVRKEKGWNDIYTIIIRGYEPITRWIKDIGSYNPKHMKKFAWWIGRTYDPAETLNS